MTHKVVYVAQEGLVSKKMGSETYNSEEGEKVVLEAQGNSTSLEVSS